MPDFVIDNKYKGVIAGVDEAGRGPWAGPVVAAAVILNRNICPDGINDSKKMTRQKREDVFHELINVCDFGVGIVDETIIDQINILNATKLAMGKAVTNLLRKPNVVLVDGNHKFDARECEIVTVIKGDSLSLSIAAASIIAKVTRDRIMTHLSIEFPMYGWERNAGYGTPEHQEAIAIHGICRYHRKSFAPVKERLAG